MESSSSSSVGKGEGEGEGEGAGFSEEQTDNPKKEELLLTVKKLKQEGNLEPRIENMISRITELLQAKKIASEELSEIQAPGQSLQKELDGLSLEEAQVKEVLSKKQETLRNLSLHCQEKEIEALRQLAMTEERKKRITQLSSNIQEERLKKRKQMMESSQPLEGMMEKHKRADTLSQEMSSSNREQLLMEERRSQEKPGSIQAQLGALSGPEGGAEAPAASGVDAFLPSAEAAAAVQLLEEENKKAIEFLEAASLHYRQLQQKYQRMKKQLEAIGHSGMGRSQERSPKGAAGGESSLVTEAVMEIPPKDQQAKPGIGHPAGSSQREVHGESERPSPQ
ncbi:synaptonemal complex central element protein 1-like [Antechinus flavipes]|uniref:synaptonemal complex central element protein 1-like n=1 Tax=Antechinus flavipes TaxID=38775 RepID=UPI002235D8C6|nr:synaptonemal complex central element protein 1-like [Antechinus flavipes]